MEAAPTDDPAALQQICTKLGPGAIRVFCERWWSRLPLPLTDADRAAGYWWEVSMRQVKVSRTFAGDLRSEGAEHSERLKCLQELLAKLVVQLDDERVHTSVDKHGHITDPEWNQSE